MYLFQPRFSLAVDKTDIYLWIDRIESIMGIDLPHNIMPNNEEEALRTFACRYEIENQCG